MSPFPFPQLPLTLCLFAFLSGLSTHVLAQCPLYQQYSITRHEPFSTGRWNLSYARPIPSCRTFHSPDLEAELLRMKSVIADPDLYRVFENAWPSTLDTTIAWHGYANTFINATYPNGTTHLEEVPTDQELTFIITGDIEAMWLRDSANQLLSYTTLLTANESFHSLASLFRGAINLQARYILEAPYCNAFQAPPESGIPARSSMNSDTITPSFDYYKVFSCNWELDSLASFLSLSNTYFSSTSDTAFFARYNWTRAVKTVLDTAESMMGGSYDDETGEWLHTKYTYCAPYGGTPINQCNGAPHRGGIGLVRSFHRPSDDAGVFQYLVPSNMMFAVELERGAELMEKLGQLLPNSSSSSSSTKRRSDPDGLNLDLDLEEEEGDLDLDDDLGLSPRNLTLRMRHLSQAIRTGLTNHAIIPFKPSNSSSQIPIYAYEIDGYGSHTIMDDPNIPSLLSIPLLGYLPANDTVYKNTRRMVLSKDNPYYAWGEVIQGPGSPHTLPGRVWPMGVLVGVLTAGEGGEGGYAGNGGLDGGGGMREDEEIFGMLRLLVGSTAGLGVMHESVSARDEAYWSRQWFSWANGLFGQAILDIEKKRPYILKMGFQ